MNEPAKKIWEDRPRLIRCTVLDANGDIVAKAETYLSHLSNRWSLSLIEVDALDEKYPNLPREVIP